jgi:hypothetical protein
MKLNQELVKRLADGEIAYRHTGTHLQFYQIINACNLDSTWSRYKYYGTAIFCKKLGSKNIWLYYNESEQELHPNLPIFTTEQFFESEPDTTGELQTERVFWECNPNENPYGDDETDHVPDVRKMDAETRELAKQLFIHNDNLTQAECIEFAIDFIKILNKHE